MAGRGFAGVVMAAVVGLVVAGCSFVAGSRLSSATCGNIAGGACSEQIDLMQQRHPGATSIEIECAAAVCDRRSGQGTVVVTLENGARVNDTFAYVGDSTPLPPPLCTNVPGDVCRKLAAQHVEDSVPPSQRVLTMHVACTAAPACTANDGSASVSITLGNGTTQGTESSWSGGPP